MANVLPESRTTLWVLAVPPAIWAVHFLLSYGTAAIWCAKFGRDGSLGAARIAIASYSVFALVVVGLVGWRGFRRHDLDGSTTPHHVDTAEARHRFLGFATLLLSGLCVIAIAFETLAVVFIGSCR